MARREKHLRISDREKAILDSTKAAVFSGDEVAYGTVIERACRSLLTENNDENEVSF